MERVCYNCAFWCAHDTREWRSGDCRRHAPPPMYSLTGPGADQPGPIWWPKTLAGFWCGDFSAGPHIAGPFEKDMLAGNTRPSREVILSARDDSRGRPARKPRAPAAPKLPPQRPEYPKWES